MRSIGAWSGLVRAAVSRAAWVKLPTIAWHLHERSFADETERRQLYDLLRQALQGKAIRFVFDRPRGPIMLAEGLDRKSPGVLLEIGLAPDAREPGRLVRR